MLHSAALQGVGVEGVSTAEIDRCPHAAAKRSCQSEGELPAMSAADWNVVGSCRPDMSVGNDCCHRGQGCR